MLPTPSFNHLGPILLVFCFHFGCILGPFWLHFGSILAPFWGSGGSLEAFQGPPETRTPKKSILDSFWEPLGSPKGPRKSTIFYAFCEAIFHSLWGPSLGAFLTAFGAPEASKIDRFGPPLGDPADSKKH